MERKPRAHSPSSHIANLTTSLSYDKETNTGGSNGATMRFAPEGDHGANAGLKAARDFLEPVKGNPTNPPFQISSLSLNYTNPQTLRTIPVDILLGPLDPRRRLRHPRDARPRRPLAPRPRRPRHIHVHPRRAPAGRRQGPNAPPRHLQPHGLRRPGDCRPVGRARPRPLPHGPLRLRRALVLLPHRRLQRLLPPPAVGEVGLEEVERAAAVRGRGQPLAHDAPDRHGARPGPRVQTARRALRQGPRGLLPRVQRRPRQAVRARGPLPEQGGRPHDVEDAGFVVNIHGRRLTIANKKNENKKTNKQMMVNNNPSMQCQPNQAQPSLAWHNIALAG